MDKKKKKGGVLKTFILCIIMIVVGIIGGYYIFKLRPNPAEINSKTAKDSKTEDRENNSNPSTTLAITDSIVVDSIDKLMHASDHMCGTEDIYFAQTKVTNQDITNELAYQTVSYKYNNNKSVLTKDQIDTEIKSYFGKDYKYTHNIYGSCSGHKYNSKTGNYEYEQTSCGGSCTGKIKYLITKAEINGSILKINVRAIFPKIDEVSSTGDVVYYNDINYTKKTSSDMYRDNPIDLFKDADEYLFTFEKYDDNNYSFISSEKTK